MNSSKFYSSFNSNKLNKMQVSSILKNAGSQMTNKKRPIAVVNDVEDESDSKTFPRIKASMAVHKTKSCAWSIYA
jgi:hypothetical protein